MNNLKHPCAIMYQLAANNLSYGDIEGVCRITGYKSKGMEFSSWVRKTFNDWASLVPGTIISCFFPRYMEEFIKIRTFDTGLGHSPRLLSLLYTLAGVLFSSSHFPSQ